MAQQEKPTIAYDAYDFETPYDATDLEEAKPEDLDTAAEQVSDDEALSKAIAQSEEYLSALQRLQADFDNFRRRNQTVRADAFGDGTRAAVEAFLPVLDNLYRAVETQTMDVEYQNGVKMILDSFVNAMISIGVAEIAADGNPFDPSLHEAILQQETEDAQSGTVLQTAQRGYIFKDRVIRAAKVVVAK